PPIPGLYDWGLHPRARPHANPDSDDAATAKTPENHRLAGFCVPGTDGYPSTGSSSRRRPDGRSCPTTRPSPVGLATTKLPAGVETAGDRFRPQPTTRSGAAIPGFAGEYGVFFSTSGSGSRT